ncbi:hypothetical protein M9Y10_031789 [Tritrichomonas musculus]|uniref:Uncharacterized protein n=1 Tax=Tritrichomonas musculus TaxID=1915356 RepID=A0ABR2GZS6_9EUKA
MEHEIKLSEKEDKFIVVFANSFPLVPLLLYFIPPLNFSRLFIKDANKLAKILLGITSEAKEEAQKPIQKDTSYEVSQATKKKQKSKKWLIMKIAFFVFSLLTTLFYYFMIEERKELNGNVKKLGRWNLLSSIRMSISVESMNYMLSAVILNGSSSLNITNTPNVVATRKRMISLCRSSLVELASFHLKTPFQPNNNAGFEAVSSTQKFDLQ